MSDFSQTIVDAFASIRGVMGVTVVYRRGSDLVELTATPGSTEYITEDVSVFTLNKTTVRDYIIAADDLILNHAKTEPLEGDTIEEVVGDERLTFRVVYPEGQSDQPFSYSDTSRTQIRIHTILTVDTDA